MLFRIAYHIMDAWCAITGTHPHNYMQTQDQQIIHTVTVQQDFWKGFRIASGIFMLLIGLWILFIYVLFPDKPIEPPLCVEPEPVAVVQEESKPATVATAKPQPQTVNNYYTQPQPTTTTTTIIQQPQPTPTPSSQTNNGTTVHVDQAEKRLCQELADMNDETISSTMTNYGSCIASYKNGLTNAVNSSLASPEQKAMLARLIALGY